MIILIKTTVLGPGLFFLCQCDEGKHYNGAYFHSQNTTANLVCHHEPPLGPLSGNAAEIIKVTFQIKNTSGALL